MSNVKEFMDAMSKVGISGDDALGAWRLAVEEKRLAREAKEKRLAQEAEMEEKRLAREMQEKRLAREAEEKRLAREAEEKRLAREAEEKRLAREAEEKRVATIERIASSSALSPEERMLALHSVRGGPSGQLALAAPKLVSFLCLFSLSLSVCVWLCVIL
jgi:hypothetical protein